MVDIQLFRSCFAAIGRGTAVVPHDVVAATQGMSLNRGSLNLAHHCTRLSAWRQPQLLHHVHGLNVQSRCDNTSRPLTTRNPLTRVVLGQERWQ